MEKKRTTVEKVKNPKRVEQGKRLAAISVEAKARKAQLKQQEQEQHSLLPSCLPYIPIIGIGFIAFGVQVYVPQNTTQFSIIHILCHKYISWTIIGFLERFSL